MKVQKQSRRIHSPNAGIEEPWDDLINTDQVSGDQFTGVESGEARTMPQQPLEESEKMRIPYSAFDIVANIGDFLEIDFDQGAADRRVTRVKVIGMYSDRVVPDVDENVMGTPQDPALKVEIYSDEDGVWRPTGVYRGIKMSELQRTAEKVA